eukprot:2518974-Rhodomonas_salina.1
MSAPDPNSVQPSTTPEAREIVSPDNNDLSTAELVGIIVGSIVGLILLLVLLYVLIWRLNVCGCVKTSDAPPPVPAKYMADLEQPAVQQVPQTKAHTVLPEDAPPDNYETDAQAQPQPQPDLEADLAFVDAADVNDGVLLSGGPPPGIIVPDMSEIQAEEEEPRRESIVGDLVYPMMAVRASQKDAILLFT